MVAIHFGIRAVLNEKISLFSRVHLATILPAVTNKAIFFLFSILCFYFFRSSAITIMTILIGRFRLGSKRECSR
ncbi:hypothetical protein A0G02_00410 [Pectobacterium peruviense]|uniref:Uncharacterized protein n=1 Tax=Pectobacterium peruviense TaxID=2066479 RepID=A0ABX4SAX7_9GAMM|nr:hypothetical protein G033_12305 [Pectobacterium peruviense]PKX83829.1 hypothetical protein A0G02_00410 [Pectobacterium peruviense]PKX87709.1 hypothetical protein A0G03_00405 [Pectobacterium peruviense]